MSATTADGAANDLRDAVDTAMQALPGAVRMIKDARAASSWDNDIIGEMRSCISLIVALKAASKVINSTELKVREALATSMSDTGAPAIQAEFHTATLKSTPARVLINGPVPEEFMTTPEPYPDLARIKAELKLRRVNWASLSEPGETLAITTRSKP